MGGMPFLSPEKYWREEESNIRTRSTLPDGESSSEILRLLYQTHHCSAGSSQGLDFFRLLIVSSSRCEYGIRVAIVVENS